MSRIGNKTITVPAGVEVSISEANEVTVKGPKGTLSRTFSPLIEVKQEGLEINCKRANEEKHTKQLHGTTRALIHNMIVGVTEGYSKTLEIEGIGYRAALSGKTLTLNLGYSHQIVYTAEEGIDLTVPNANTIVVSGIDKQRVGEVASVIRSYRKPEPYKGKGIHYKGEHIRRKEGKTAGK
ncbi:MAG: 50S ribosomal protein L6 [Erysipelotrichaceae bacterium]|nr:50S ribosomal protein L6 [Erysipelotrichaceae bacterium]